MMLWVLLAGWIALGGLFLLFMSGATDWDPD